MNESCVTRAKFFFICPHKFLDLPPVLYQQSKEEEALFVVWRQRARPYSMYVCICTYVCMCMYLCMQYVPGGCTKVRYLRSACQVKISSPLYSTYESIFVLQRKLYLLQIREEKLKPLTNEPKINVQDQTNTLKFTFYSSGMHNTHIIHTAVRNTITTT